MKKVLITGANSYIGTSFDRYLKEKYPDQYEVDTVDMIDGAWRKKSFSGYDSVFHVAGIAHKKETRVDAELYFAINRDLTIECAKKAKCEGVKQFVFLSSMSVYGITFGHIDQDIRPRPVTNYGKSKLQAEDKLMNFLSDTFRIAVIRPPMVYGKGCKGNYTVLSKLARELPIFPSVKNERSMIYIDNLCEFVRLIIQNDDLGIFYPQNKEYVNTTELACLICRYNGKKSHTFRLPKTITVLLKETIPSFRKAFETLVYDQHMSEYSEDYSVVNFENSVKMTEEN